MTSGPELETNLEQAAVLAREAASNGVRFLSFPENFALMSDDKDQIRNQAQGPKSRVPNWLKDQARLHKMWILAGSVPWDLGPRNKKIGNTALLVSPQGRVVASYQKIHLFDVRLSADRVYEESRRVEAGRKVVTAPLKWSDASGTHTTRVGLSICYDLRFPELYRQIANAGAEIITIPSAFTKLTGEAHWDALTRARAIESQAFVIAAAQCGSPYAGRFTYGHARVIDPWGHVLAERPDGIGLAIADLNFEVLYKTRHELPSLQHQRLISTGLKRKHR